MPSFDDLVGQALIRTPNNTYDYILPSFVGSIEPETVPIEIKVQKDRRGGFICVTIDELCPLCDQPLGPRVPEWFEALPVTTLDVFPDLLAKLWNGSTESPRATNPQGRRIPKGLQRLQGLACLQHQYESAIIPLSVQFKWPRFANFFGLLKIVVGKKVTERVAIVLDRPWHGLIISGSIPEVPSRKLKALLELATHEFIRSAGYYGLRGWAIIMRYAALLLPELGEGSDITLDDYSSPERFIELFVLPEIIAVVISEEYQCSLEAGLHMAWLSDPFGMKEYPSDVDCLVLKRVQDAQSTEDLRHLVDAGEEAFMAIPDEAPVRTRAPKRQKIR